MKVGGAYVYALAHGGKVEVTFTRWYLEIEPAMRVIYTAAMAPFPDEIVVGLRYGCGPAEPGQRRGLAGQWIVSPPVKAPLPAEVRTLFWEHGDQPLSLEKDRDFVVGRALSAGSWETIRWLRDQVGEPVLREYLNRTRGRLLSPRQLRLWQVLLDLPEEAVSRWIESAARQVWDRRAG